MLMLGEFSIPFHHHDGRFPLLLVDAIYRQLSQFYIDKTAEKQKQTCNIAKANCHPVRAGSLQ